MRSAASEFITTLITSKVNRNAGNFFFLCFKGFWTRICHRDRGVKSFIEEFPHISEIGNKCSDDFLQVLPENRNITSKEFGERFIIALMATGQAVINQFLITLVCHHQCPRMVQVLRVGYRMDGTLQCTIGTSKDGLVQVGRLL